MYLTTYMSHAAIIESLYTLDCISPRVKILLSGLNRFYYSRRYILRDILNIYIYLPTVRVDDRLVYSEAAIVSLLNTQYRGMDPYNPLIHITLADIADVALTYGLHDCLKYLLGYPSELRDALTILADVGHTERYTILWDPPYSQTIFPHIIAIDNVEYLDAMFMHRPPSAQMNHMILCNGSPTLVLHSILRGWIDTDSVCHFVHNAHSTRVLRRYCADATTHIPVVRLLNKLYPLDILQYVLADLPSKHQPRSYAAFYRIYPLCLPTEVLVNVVVLSDVHVDLLADIDHHHLIMAIEIAADLLFTKQYSRLQYLSRTIRFVWSTYRTPQRVIKYLHGMRSSNFMIYPYPHHSVCRWGALYRAVLMHFQPLYE